MSDITFLVSIISSAVAGANTIAMVLMYRRYLDLAHLSVTFAGEVIGHLHAEDDGTGEIKGPGRIDCIITGSSRPAVGSDKNGLMIFDMVYPYQFRHICAVIRPGDRRERRFIPAFPASSGVRMLRSGSPGSSYSDHHLQNDTFPGRAERPRQIYSLHFRDIRATILWN
ncbi:MAG TPA: hypothetical protein VN372_01525 [Methanospirillum sp.]|nr:hypothetical protein [Methanospirillum sp.]